MEEKKSILAVALDDETFERIAPLLRRDSLSVRAAGQGSKALSLAQRDRFHLVICRYPLPDLKLREFVTAIRAAGSASKSASLRLKVPRYDSYCCVCFSHREKAFSQAESFA